MRRYLYVWKGLTTMQGKRLLGMSILLVEDTPDLQAVFSRLLRRQGAQVEVVENGKEALEKAMHSPFDLILMDIQMPVMDGYEAASELRRLNYLKPVVALTARLMVEEQKEIHKVGFDGCIPKPTEHEQFIDMVSEYWHDQHSRGA